MNNKRRGLQQYRGKGRRESRKEKHLSRVEMESKMLALKASKTLDFFVKDVKDDFTPTDYFIVEFRLKDKMSLEAFKNMVYLMVVGWL